MASVDSRGVSLNMGPGEGNSHGNLASSDMLDQVRIHSKRTRSPESLIIRFGMQLQTLLNPSGSIERSGS